MLYFALHENASLLKMETMSQQIPIWKTKILWPTKLLTFEGWVRGNGYQILHKLSIHLTLRQLKNRISVLFQGLLNSRSRTYEVINFKVVLKKIWFKIYRRFRFLEYIKCLCALGKERFGIARSASLASSLKSHNLALIFDIILENKN